MKKAKATCQATVYTRCVPFSCSRRAGFGPLGAYCRQHAAEHETAEPTLTLWRSSRVFRYPGEMPEPVKVREIGERTFVDAGGHRHPMKDSWSIYYRSETDALAATRNRLRKRIEGAAQELRDARDALKRLDKLMKRKGVSAWS